MINFSLKKLIICGSFILLFSCGCNSQVNLNSQLSCRELVTKCKDSLFYNTWLDAKTYDQIISKYNDSVDVVNMRENYCVVLIHYFKAWKIYHEKYINNATDTLVFKIISDYINDKTKEPITGYSILINEYFKQRVTINQILKYIPLNFYDIEFKKEFYNRLSIAYKDIDSVNDQRLIFDKLENEDDFLIFFNSLDSISKFNKINNEFLKNLKQEMNK